MNHCLLFSVNDPKQSAAARGGGVYRIATILRNNSWDVEVIDFAMSWSLSELKQLAKSRISKDTKFFGFSHMFSDWSETLEMFLNWVKTEYPDIKLISGSSVNPLFNSKHFDWYIRGYGEHAILVLLKYLFSNGEKPKYWINTGKKIINAITDYPAYPMEDLGIVYEKRDFIQPSEFLAVEFSRGCMFSCDFCNFPLLGIKEDTSRTAESFRNEMMRNYDELGVTNYGVADETFNDRPAKIKKFADVVEKLPFEPFFTGFIRADLLVSRKDDRVDMARMNFRGHYYGIESFNYQSAKVMGKGMKPERLQEGIVEVKNYFKNTGNGMYRGTMSFIVGLPHETHDSLMKTREWLINNWQGENIMIFPLTIPNSELQVKPKIFDYKKYGYTEMPNNTAVENNTLVPPFALITPALEETKIDGMCWKNEHMDVFSARKIISDDFYNDEFIQKMNIKVGNYEMASYVYGNKTAKERLELDSSAMVAALSSKDVKYQSKQFMYDFMRDKFIEDYKQRKLSL